MITGHCLQGLHDGCTAPALCVCPHHGRVLVSAETRKLCPGCGKPVTPKINPGGRQKEFCSRACWRPYRYRQRREEQAAGG